MTGQEPTAPIPREDGPTELVEGNDGELVERLSGGTATLLLAWLIGVGAGSALLAAWLLAALVLRSNAPRDGGTCSVRRGSTSRSTGRPARPCCG